MARHGTMHGIGKGVLEMGPGWEAGRGSEAHGFARHRGQCYRRYRQEADGDTAFVCLPAGDATTG